MRILLVNTFYYPKLIGGAEISVQLLAEGLSDRKNQVFVITLGDKDEVVKHNGVVVIRLKERNVFSPFGNKKRSFIQKVIWFLIDSANPFYNTKLKRILDKIKPDIVHTNNVQGFSPHIWKVFKKANVPLMHTMRDYYLLCHRCNMHNKVSNCQTLCAPCALTHRIKKRYMDYPDMFIGISDFIVKRHRDFKILQSKDRQVVYNAVDIPQSPAIKTKGDQIVFGFMGRIAEDKGVDYLLEQVRMVHKKSPDRFALIFAGKGNADYLDVVGEKLKGITHDFLGVVKPAEFYKQIDVSIVPSIWEEPFGRVAIEALAHGIPVCMSNKGGLPEIYHPDCAWLFDPDTNDLSTTLSAIIGDPTLIDEKRKHTRIQATQFSKENNIDNYLRLYGLVNKHNTLNRRVSCSISRDVRSLE